MIKATLISDAFKDGLERKGQLTSYPEVGKLLHFQWSAGDWVNGIHDPICNMREYKKFSFFKNLLLIQTPNHVYEVWINKSISNLIKDAFSRD